MNDTVLLQNQLVNKSNFPRGSFFTLWSLLETIAFRKLCIISSLFNLRFIPIFSFSKTICRFLPAFNLNKYFTLPAIQASRLSGYKFPVDPIGPLTFILLLFCTFSKEIQLTGIIGFSITAFFFDWLAVFFLLFSLRSFQNPALQALRYTVTTPLKTKYWL